MAGSGATAHARNAVVEAVESRREELSRLSRDIHDHPETCFEETTAASLVSEALLEGGLEVEEGVCGLPTALIARAGSGPLSVAICAEYDALPGIGHACGHNIIAAAAVGAGIALSRVADDVGLTVSVLGTPAEEGGGGKILMLERGAFAGTHAAMMVHPWPQDRLTARCLAVDHLEVRYQGREAHASASPEKGRNAADALVVAQVAIGLLRQHLPSQHQVHGIVTSGGEAPNIVPKEAAGDFMVRAPTLTELAELRPRVERCFEAGALATQTELTITKLSPTYSQLVSDDRLLAAYRRNAQELGRDYEEPSGSSPPTFSTDMANVSLALPSIHPLIGIDSKGSVNHQPEFAEACVGASAERAIFDGAVAMAWTAIDAATREDLRELLLAGTG